MLVPKLFNKYIALFATTCIELLVYDSIQGVNADLPDPRWGHSAVLLNNNLYIYGGKVGITEKGINDTSQNSNQFLVLDVSKSFSVSNPAWLSLRPNNSPRVAFHTLSIGGSRNELLVLYGGEYPKDSTPENPLFYYNTLDESSQWNNANLSLGVRRMSHTAVTKLDDSTNYFFGGIPDISDPRISSQFQFQDLFKLDTRNNLWNIQSVDSNTPSPRFHHTATILNGKMYLVGGYSRDKLVDMNQIHVYDTISAKWDVKTAVGDLVPRRCHVAVGTYNGKVIIHGGVSENYDEPYGDVAVLDTTDTTQFTWNAIKTSGTQPSARYSHTATMAGINMIIAFGFLKGDVGDNNIYVLDTESFMWTEDYAPKSLEYTNTNITPSDPGGHSKSSKAGVIAGSVVGVTLFLSLMGGLFLFFYRRRRRSPNDNDFYSAPYSSTQEPQTVQNKQKKFSVSSESTAVERPSTSSGLTVPMNVGAHRQDHSMVLEEKMMDSDVQQTNFMIVPKSPLRVTNPDND